MIKSICNYIQNGDRNSDIMDAYKEMERGDMELNQLEDICRMILTDWKEDLELNGMTKREKEYYSYLNI
jgi:hypothetical protein